MRIALCSLTVLNAIIASCILASIGIVDGISSAAFLIAVAVVTVTCIAPRFSLLLFLAALPIFGNRSTTFQAYLLSAVGSGLIIGLNTKLLASPARTEPWRVLTSNRVCQLMLLYLVVSALSLSGLAWFEIYNQARSQIPSLRDFSALAYFIHRALWAGEEQLVYSPLSVIWTSFAFEIGFFVVLYTQDSTRKLVQTCTAILTGLLLALVFGLADYYALIDMRWLRALDPVVNPGNVEFRLQSFFGHSGWFAEYITLTIPFALLLLLFPIGYGLRVALLLVLMTVGEFTLILSFQRGGWLSYPLTLVAIWSAIYVSRKLELGETQVIPALRASAIKVALSLPLTIALSLGCLQLLTTMNALPPGIDAHVSKYTDRFKEIQKTSDRSKFFTAGYKLGMLQPVLGTGSESFAWQFEREFNEPQGRYFQQIDLPLHGSAHNVYMQTFSGKGLIGLAALLTLLLVVIYLALKSVLYDPAQDIRRRNVLLITVCFCAAFLIYGNVQEIFYIQALQYLFFAVLGLAAAALSGMAENSASASPRIWVILFIALVLHISWSFYYPGREIFNRVKNQEFGCHGLEQDERGQNFQWCGVRARKNFVALQTDGKYELKFKLQAAPRPQNSTPRLSSIQMRIHDRLIWEQALIPSETIEKTLNLPGELVQSSNDMVYTVEISTAHYIIPQRDLTGGSDERVLSYRLFTN